jgi:hypothetical protein
MLPKTEIQETPQPKDEKPGAEQTNDKPESPAETTKCPDREDARKAVDEGAKIIAEVRGILKDAKNPNFADQLATADKQLSDWQAHNSVLTIDCGLLLGADGTSVYPEIPLALENLTLAGVWLEKSINAATIGQMSTSGLYLKAADKAIKQASKLLDKKVKPDRRTAVVRTPSYLKSVEKRESKVHTNP